MGYDQAIGTRASLSFIPVPSAGPADLHDTHGTPFGSADGIHHETLVRCLQDLFKFLGCPFLSVEEGSHDAIHLESETTGDIGDRAIFEDVLIDQNLGSRTHGRCQTLENVDGVLVTPIVQNVPKQESCGRRICWLWREEVMDGELHAVLQLLRQKRGSLGYHMWEVLDDEVSMTRMASDILAYLPVATSNVDNGGSRLVDRRPVE